MLYQFYETQRALMSPFSEFASASSKLYSHPLSPFAHTPMAQRVSAGLDLMHRLAKDYEKPRVRHPLGRRSTASRSRCRSRWRSRSRSAGCCASSASPTTCRRCSSMKAQPTVLVVAPLSGHHSTLLRDTVRELLRGPQGLHHRLDRRAHGADRRRARSISTTTSPTCRSSSATIGPEVQRDLGLPADRAGAGGDLADGQRRRADAAHDDDDGRPDRRPQVARPRSTTWR